MAEPTTLTVAARLEDESIELVHDLAERLWQAEPDVDPTDRIRLETAVAEVIGNIVKHTRRLDAAGADTRRVHVTMWCDADEVGAEFVDNGLPAAIDLSQVTLPDDEAESGRGLALALAAVDELDYERRSGRNHWRLRCRRSA